MRQKSRRRDRGFTLVELMIVVGVIGVIASLAIPNYLRFTAKSSRSEMLETLGKMRLHFKQVYDNTGSFVTPSTAAANTTSAINPPAVGIPVGQPASWDPHLATWSEFGFPPEGGVKMRYWYTMGPADVRGNVGDVTFTVCGSLPGLGATTVVCPAGMTGPANYLYTEVFHANGASEAPVEFPEF